MNRIRRGTEHDLGGLAEIERAADRLFPGGRIPPEDEPTPREVLTRALSCGLLLVAQVDGAIVGFSVAEPISRDFHLRLVAVHPDYGRRGLGRALVVGVIDEAERRGLDRVTLTTFEDIPWNAPFYSRLGFRVIEEQDLTPQLRSILSDERSVGVTKRVAMHRAVREPGVGASAAE